MRSGLLFAALLSVSTAAGAAPSPAAEAKAEFDKANRFFLAHEFEAALPHFEKAYVLSGKRPSTIRALAQCERALNRYEDALAHFREYLATTPRPTDAGAIEETITLLLEVKAEADRAAEVARAAEQAARDPAPPVPAPLPSAAPSPPPSSAPVALVAPSPPEEEGIWSSPVLWIVGAVAIVGAGVAVGVVAGQPSEPAPYGGSSGVVLGR